MKLDTPYNTTPITAKEIVSTGWATWFQQVYNAITGGEIDIIRVSPNGTRYRLGVDDGGNTVWTVI